MADERDRSNDVGAEDVDLGAPVEVLSQLRQSPPVGFLSGIRGRIQRRHLVADTADFSLAGMACVALAFVTALLQVFQSSRRTEGEE